MSQKILPRSDVGMDWGAKRRLIAATPDQGIVLFIRGGHLMSMGARGFGRDYQKAALILHAKHTGSQHGRWLTLGEGRISNTTLRAAAAQINATFGREIAQGLDVHKTLWVTPAGLVEIV